MHSGLIFKVLPLALARLRQFLHSSSSNSCGVFLFRFTTLLGFSLGITAAVSTAGSGSTAALGAMNDDEGGIVNAAAISPWDVATAHAASSTAGSGSTAARGAMDDEDDCCVNAAAPSPWDVAPARAACSAAGSGSTAALGAMDNDDDCFFNAAAISPWDVAPARAAFKSA